MKISRQDEKALIRALSLQSQGQSRDAANIVAGLLGRHPNWADAHAAFGMLCADLGHPDLALAHSTAAVRLQPDQGRFHANRFALNQALGNDNQLSPLALEWTLACPNDPQGWVRFAELLLARRDLTRADPILAKAEALGTGTPEILALRGQYYLQTGDTAKALTSLQKAVADHALRGEQPPLIWSINLAAAYLRADDPMAALQALPDGDAPAELCATAFDLRASALRRLGQVDAALPWQHKAISIRPQRADYWHNMGILYRDSNAIMESQASFERALQLQPGQPMSLWAKAVAVIPVLAENQTQIIESRAQLIKGLDQLNAQFSGINLALWSQAAASVQTFHAAYHGQDDLPVQRRFGGLIQRIMRARYPEAASPPTVPPLQNGKLVIAIASAHIYDHSVWKIPLRGWLERLDRSKFAVHLYHLGGRIDAQTDHARSLSDSMTHCPGQDDAVITALQSLKPHILLYPEIGMDPAILRLASLHLAPVQAMGLGHPVTTGLDSIGWFLTSGPMQTDASDALFDEKLVRLPGIGCWYTPPERAPSLKDRSAFGLPEQAVLLLSPQSLFKYQPRHDALLAQIALAAPKAVLVFIEGENLALTTAFQVRLYRAFAAVGLNWQQHCAFVPRQSGEDFQRLCEICDVFLDSIGWSGFNTSCEAAAAGLPILTWPDGGQTHARHAAAVLMQLGLSQTIASSAEEYVALAARLATDTTFRAEQAAAIRHALPRLWHDMAPIEAMEDWMVKTVEEARQR